MTAQNRELKEYNENENKNFIQLDSFLKTRRTEFHQEFLSNKEKNDTLAQIIREKNNLLYHYVTKTELCGQKLKSRAFNEVVNLDREISARIEERYFIETYWGIKRLRRIEESDLDFLYSKQYDVLKYLYVESGENYNHFLIITASFLIACTILFVILVLFMHSEVLVHHTLKVVTTYNMQYHCYTSGYFTKPIPDHVGMLKTVSAPVEVTNTTAASYQHVGWFYDGWGWKKFDATYVCNDANMKVNNTFSSNYIQHIDPSKFLWVLLTLPLMFLMYSINYFMNRKKHGKKREQLSKVFGASKIPDSFEEWLEEEIENLHYNFLIGYEAILLKLRCRIDSSSLTENQKNHLIVLLEELDELLIRENNIKFSDGIFPAIMMIIIALVIMTIVLSIVIYAHGASHATNTTSYLAKYLVPKYNSTLFYPKTAIPSEGAIPESHQSFGYTMNVSTKNTYNYTGNPIGWMYLLLAAPLGLSILIFSMLSGCFTKIGIQTKIKNKKSEFLNCVKNNSLVSNNSLFLNYDPKLPKLLELPGKKALEENTESTEMALENNFSTTDKSKAL